ncbi:UDP-2,4-diacetamido-2,4,6-trideoxy-beta-L-altropyranose hydrolase [Vibrio brasiliensis]|uniref:UDP-2,4-diacetamido-2,4, 6-trideoxy-beta-L-altropyranose hydrolase n=1 Tax=Vibrio brasiliensis TaxID=170652 RepID=UPI001EFEE7FA|nr:UDP-2,4-diacetamido-2,4,6-trideoxy-beta-L-altropyranose hydrolase [Vibrio brasiliensis]MCG9752994.1 UDP-2,4-diacetamido-2,4,6-trideoxy-beta-L-altropyranose hydrolase [Vibrio brasiliensis]
MKVVFRVDASIYIGSGHVMRCLVLADELKKRGAEVKFSCIAQQGDMIDFIRERGHVVEVLLLDACSHTPTCPDDYLGWLRRPLTVDAQDFIEKNPSPDIVVTDHYAIGEAWQTLVKEKTGCLVVAIDDLERSHNADLIVDQTLGRHADSYRSDGLVLTGIDFALLAPQFALNRRHAQHRKIDLDKIKVLISMGGIDQNNVTYKVAKAMAALEQVELTILMSRRSPHFDCIADWSKHQPNVVHLDFVHDMASLMIDHDISIGAAGSTSWERACLGMPSIIVPLADNQKEICRQLVTHKMALAIEQARIDSDIKTLFLELCANWNDFVQNNFAICDGIGAQRVVNELYRLVNENYDSM